MLRAKDHKLNEAGQMKWKDIDSNAEIKILNCRNDVKEKFYLSNDNILQDASDILNDILFDSKEKSWELFLDELSCYVDWLYTHSVDVALISLIIALELNYKEEILRNICLGALLHDIGKLFIPQNIIQKPGKLNKQEMSLMKKHCEFGYSMIKDSNLPKECTDIIFQHHECLDGSGYPHGLRDKQITNTAKIVSIADILDAITSYRPYKSVQSLNAAINELKKCELKYERNVIQILEIYL